MRQDAITTFAILLVGIPIGLGVAASYLGFGPTPGQADVAMEKMAQIIGMGNFAPHVYCLANSQGLIALIGTGHILIGLSYVVTPIGLVLILLDIFKNKSYSGEMFAVQAWRFASLFALFIAMCGGGHFISWYTLFVPDYWMFGFWNFGTALVSIFTSVALFAARKAALDGGHQHRFQRDQEYS